MADEEIGIIDVDQELATFDIEVDDEEGQFVGEIEIDESQQPGIERKFGGGVAGAETFLVPAEPESFIDKAFDIFKDPEKEKAKATQALIDAELFNIKPSQAYDFKKSIDRVSASRNSIGVPREELGKKVLEFQNSPAWNMLPGEFVGAAAGVISGTAKFVKAVEEARKAGVEERAGKPNEDLKRSFKDRLDMMLESGYYTEGEYQEQLKNLDQYTIDSQKPTGTEKWIKENIYEPTAETAGKILTKVEESTEEFSRDLLPQYVGTFTENPSWRRAFSALAAGGGSMAIAIPISVVAGPESGAAILSMAEAGPVYEFARERGKTKQESLNFALSTALATFFLEKYGLERVMGAKGTKVQRFFRGATAESTTEISQTVVQNAIKKYGIDDSVRIFDEIIESAIGGLVGGPTAVMFNGKKVLSEVEKDNLIDTSEKAIEVLSPEENEFFTTLSEEEPKAVVLGSIEEKGEIVGYTMADMDTGNTFEVGAYPTIEEVRKGRESVRELTELDAKIQSILEMEEKDIDSEIERILSEQEQEELGSKTERFRNQVLEIVLEKQADAVVALLSARAKAVGLTPDEYIEYHGLEVRKGVEGEEEGELSQVESPVLLSQDEKDVNFKKWSNDYEVLESNDILNAEPDKGKVFRVYHGTTNAFDIFDPTIKGTKESHFGQLNYFTSDIGDADINYAGEGPDLTSRIEQLAERIEDEYADVDQLSDELGLDADELEAAKNNYEASRQLASEALAGGADRTLDVYVRLDNPAYIGGDTQTWIENFDEEALREDAKEQILEENDADESQVDEFEDEIDDRYYEIQSYETPAILEAIQNALYEVETFESVTAEEIYNELELYDGEITATELDKKLRESSVLLDAMDLEEGGLISNHIIGLVFKHLGYDGIVLQNANQQFPGMGMGSGTSHVHVFDTPTQIKSATANIGTYDSSDPSILKQGEGQEEIITKADVTFNDTETIIRAFESADVSSLVHELGHVFRRDLDAADLAIAEKWAGVKDGNWEELDENGVPLREEKFARAFEKYLADGKAPNTELQGIFEQFKQWLTEIYRAIKGSSIDIKITPEIQGVFDRLLVESEIVENEGKRILQQKAESIKTRIRRETGQVKDTTKTISERDALREVLKRSAMAARKAMSEGNKAGVIKEKMRMKEILTRASERRKKSASVKQIKARIKRELKFAKAKKVSGKLRGKFTPEIQETLDKLIAISKLKKDDAETRLLENLERYPEEVPEDVALENHLLEMVARIDTMVEPDQLQSLLDEIKALKNEGRLINNLRAFNRSEAIRGKVEATIEELGGIPDDIQIKGVQEYTAKTLSAKAKQALKNLGKTMSAWDTLMDMLSSKSKTKPGESFISRDNNLNEYKNREKRGAKQALNYINEKYMEAFDLKTNRQTMNKILKDKAEEIVFKNMPMQDPVTGEPMEIDLTFTRSELRKKAMELLDPTLWPTFEQMGYTEQTAIEISEALTPQDKVFIESAMEFYQDYYNGNNEVYKRITGVNLPFNPLYSPISREGVSKPVEGVSEFLTEMSFRASAQTAGALKARVDSTKHIAKQNDISVIERHIAEMEHFKAWAERVRDLNAVWKDPKVRAAVEINHGKDILFLVDKHISDIALGNVTTGNLLKGLDRFRVNFVKAQLAVKPAMIPKQLSSFIAFAEKMPVDQFVKNMVLFWKDPVKHTKELYTSDMLQSRGQNIERDLKAAMQTKEHAAFAKSQSFINMLLLNVQIGDQGAIVLGGWPYYKYMKDQGKTHEEAIAEMEKFSDLTQQSADITEQSYWQRGGPLAKLFTMFMSSPNLYLQKEIGAVRNFLTGRQGIKQTAKTLVIYHIILPSLFQFMSDRFTWDEDEQKRAMILGALNGWFIVGDALDWMLRKAMGMEEFNMEIPIYSVAHDIIKATALIEAFDLTAEEFFKAMRGLTGVVGTATGLPTKQAVDIGKGAYDVLDGEYEQGITEMMGYSPYKAKQLARD